MAILLKVSTLSIRYWLGTLARGAGLDLGERSTDAVIAALERFFTDPSQRVLEAVQEANRRTWSALEFSLEEVSWWRGLLTRKEEKNLREKILQVLAQAAPTTRYPDHGRTFRRRCLTELKQAQETGLLTGGHLSPAELARAAGPLAQYDNPARLLTAERQLTEQLGEELRLAGYETLAYLVELRPSGEATLLSAIVQHFLTNEFREDPRLFRGVALDILTGVRQRLAELERKLDQVVELSWDLLREAKQQAAQHALYEDVHRLLQESQLYRKELLPTHSASVQSPESIKHIKDLLKHFGTLPAAQQRAMPVLLNDLGKLLYAAGLHHQAAEVFRQVTTVVSERTALAEPHFNAYRNALALREWAAALEHLREAIVFAPERAPFSFAEYEPQEILGAGGFGVVFRCRDLHLDQAVVIKALITEGLGVSADSFLREARALVRLNHPAIIRVYYLRHADEQTRSRPYLLMEHFAGQNLEQHVEQHGALAEASLVQLGLLLGEALEAAHADQVHHLDVKPSNLLVRRENDRWRIKLIDFGLARQVLQQELAQTRSRHTRTLFGTLNYAAPEQTGLLPGVLGPHTDVYGFGKLCCYALFKTPNPVRRHWERLSSALADLLSSCIEDEPGERPADFTVVLQKLRQIRGPDEFVLLPTPLTGPLPDLRPTIAAGPAEPVAAPAPVETTLAQPQAPAQSAAPAPVPPGHKTPVVPPDPAAPISAPVVAKIPNPRPVPVPHHPRPRQRLWDRAAPAVAAKEQAKELSKKPAQLTARWLLTMAHLSVPSGGRQRTPLDSGIPIQPKSGQPFLLHGSARPLLVECIRLRSDTYPLPFGRPPDQTLEEWLRTHGGPPDWHAVRLLLAAYGLRLPTVVQLRTALAAEKLPRPPAPIWVREERHRLFLPSQQVGLPQDSDLEKMWRCVVGVVETR